MLTVTLMSLTGATSPTACDQLRMLSTAQVAVMTADLVPAGVFVPPAPP